MNTAIFLADKEVKMPKVQKSQLNDKASAVIEDNILLENPEGLPDQAGLVKCTSIPEMRKVQFVNGRDPGYPLDFHYHSKTHPLKQYTLHHGFDYDLPEEIIDHLENCCERQYGYRKSREGHPEMYVKGLKYLFQCKSVRKAA